MISLEQAVKFAEIMEADDIISTPALVCRALLVELMRLNAVISDLQQKEE